MAEQSKSLQIDTNELIGKLRALQDDCGGDLALVMERLLLENHILRLGQSKGMTRGARMKFSTFPRFLKLSEPYVDDKPSGQI